MGRSALPRRRVDVRSDVTRDELIDLNVNALPAVALAPGMISALLGADAGA